MVNHVVCIFWRLFRTMEHSCGKNNSETPFGHLRMNAEDDLRWRRMLTCNLRDDVEESHRDRDRRNNLRKFLFKIPLDKWKKVGRH